MKRKHKFTQLNSTQFRIYSSKKIVTWLNTCIFSLESVLTFCGGTLSSRWCSWKIPSWFLYFLFSGSSPIASKFPLPSFTKLIKILSLPAHESFNNVTNSHVDKISGIIMQKPTLKLEMRDQRKKSPTLRLFAKFSLAEGLKLTRKWVGESWLKPWRRWSWLGEYDEGKNSFAKGFSFVNMSTSFWTLNSDSALGFESILVASAGISATAAIKFKVTTPTKTLNNLQP